MQTNCEERKERKRARASNRVPMPDTGQKIKLVSLISRGFQGFHFLATFGDQNIDNLLFNFFKAQKVETHPFFGQYTLRLIELET
jgi:hypothetical protein